MELHAPAPLLAIPEGSTWPIPQSTVNDPKKTMDPVTCVNFYAMIEDADYEQRERMAEWLKEKGGAQKLLVQSRVRVGYGEPEFADGGELPQTRPV